MIFLLALIANSRRNSSDFETEWPTWTVPKSDSNAYNSASKVEAGNGGGMPHKKTETKNPSNVPTIHSSVTNYSNIESKQQLKNKKNHLTPPESTKSLYEAASNAATALLSTQEPTDLPDLSSSDTIDPSIAAKAAAKAQRKQVKKAEKERRKLEKKKRKILEKQQQQMKQVSTLYMIYCPVMTQLSPHLISFIFIYFHLKAENGSNLDMAVALEDKNQECDDSEDDVEIVEDENGQCTVRIKPKPIKLKIINPYATQNTVPDKSTQAKKRKLSTEEPDNTNGHLNESSQSDQSLPTAKKPCQDLESTPKSASGRPKTPTQRDTRSHCDKVGTIT